MLFVVESGSNVQRTEKRAESLALMQAQEQARVGVKDKIIVVKEKLTYAIVKETYYHIKKVCFFCVYLLANSGLLVPTCNLLQG